jgi:P27 family predicted phage terminase small subunit
MNKPKPTALKILQGTAQPCRINKKEPKPKVSIPSCPPHLCAEGKKEWKRITKELARLKLITHIDRAALSGYCTGWAKYVEASVAIQKTGYLVKSKNGIPYINPLVTVQNKALEQMKGFLTEFGMTPSSRSRISISEQPDESNPFDQFN